MGGCRRHQDRGRRWQHGPGRHRGRLGAERRLRFRLGDHQAGHPHARSGRRSAGPGARARGDRRREPRRQARQARRGGREDLCLGRHAHRRDRCHRAGDQEGRRRYRGGRGRGRVRLRQPAHRRGEVQHRHRYRRVLPGRLPGGAGCHEELPEGRLREGCPGSLAPHERERGHDRCRPGHRLQRPRRARRQLRRGQRGHRRQRRRAGHHRRRREGALPQLPGGEPLCRRRLGARQRRPGHSGPGGRRRCQGPGGQLLRYPGGQRHGYRGGRYLPVDPPARYRGGRRCGRGGPGLPCHRRLRVEGQRLQGRHLQHPPG